MCKVCDEAIHQLETAKQERDAVGLPTYTVTAWPATTPIPKPQETFKCGGTCGDKTPQTASDYYRTDGKAPTCYRCGGPVLRTEVKSYAEGSGGIMSFSTGVPVTLHGTEVIMTAIQRAITQNAGGWRALRDSLKDRS